MSASRSSSSVAQTERLLLRRLDAGDASFILELVNEPGWLRYIGDKGVKNLADAVRYIENGPVAMYERLGFGLYLVQLQESGASIGICGLIKREALEDVDLGFAFLPDFRGNGYALEAATAVMAYGRSTFGLQRIVAILTPDNDRSVNLLEKLAFRFERMFRLSPAGGELMLYATGM